jgi:PAS domain S-box-containing protein
MTTKSLISKLKILVFLIAVIPILLTAFVAQVIYTDTLDKSLARLGGEMREIDSASEKIGDMIMEKEKQAHRAAEDPFLAVADEKAAGGLLRSYLAGSSPFMAAHLFEAGGSPRLSISLKDGGEVPGPPPSSEWLALVEKGGTVRTPVTQAGGGRAYYTLAMPLMKPGTREVAGALLVSVSLKEVLGGMEGLVIRNRSLAYVLDEKGRIVYESHQQWPHPFAAPGEAVKEYARGYELEKSGSTLILVSALPIPHTGLSLVLKVPVDEIAGISRQAWGRTGLIALVSVILAFLISQYIAKRIAAPLEQLQQATSDLASHISGEKVAPTGEADEIRKLMKVSNEVHKRLRSYVEEKQNLYSRTRERLEKKVQELKAIHSLTESFTTFKDFPELLRFIMEQMKSIFSARFCCIYLKRDDGRFVKEAGLITQDGEPGEWPGEFPVNSEPFLDITSSASPIIIQDISNESEELFKDRFFDGQTGAYCALPLMVGVNLFGILELGLEKGKGLQEGDIRLLMTLAKEASIAIENAQLYQKMIKEKERLETVLATISDGLLTMDGDYRITSFNNAAEKITGHFRSDMLGRNCFDVFKTLGGDGSNELLCSEMECVLKTALAQRQFPLQSEHAVTTPKGDRKILEFSTTIDRHEVSGNVSYFSVFRDVSKYKELERLRADFIDTISHELRTPLTSIKGYVSTLLHPRAKFSVEEIQEFLNIINEETNRLNRMISDLIEASRLHRDTLSIKPQPFRIKRSIENLITKHKSITTRHSFEVTLEGDPILYGDLNQLEFVINHLLENAVKFSPDGGRVRVMMSSGGEDEALVMIEDEGVGVPEEHRDKIFNLFHRVDNRSVRRIYGPGLGLFISKKIIEAHGKRIWVESGLNGGAKFVFNLPKYKGSEPVEVPPT